MDFDSTAWTKILIVADLVSYNILLVLYYSFDDITGSRPLKSEEISSGVLFSIIIYGMPALIAASTPNGEFSTTIASEGLMFIICNAIWNGLGSGFHYPTSSPVTIISKFFKPMFSSSVVSISCLAEPLATAFKHLQLSNH